MSGRIKSYFERKKRDLSDNQTTRKREKKPEREREKERKRERARESSLYLQLSKETNDDNDTFTEGIESPRCASILNYGLKNIKTKVTDFLPLPKTPRLKVLGSWKMSVNPLSP